MIRSNLKKQVEFDSQCLLQIVLFFTQHLYKKNRHSVTVDTVLAPLTISRRRYWDFINIKTNGKYKITKIIIIIVIIIIIIIIVKCQNHQ